MSLQTAISNETASPVDASKDELKATHTSNLDPEKQEPTSTSSSPQWVTGIKLWIIMTGVTLVCLLMLLDVSILSTAIPKITTDFHSLQDVGWYGAAYQLSSAVLQPLTGKIYTNFSAKWTFFGFFLFFELGSLLCGVAVSSKMLIVGRAVAGMGASGLQNGAMTILAACVPMSKRPALLGVMMGVSQLGLVGGPLVGGVLTQYASWRWCFFLNLPVGGLVAALLLFTRVPEQVTKPPPGKVVRDLPNMLDLTGFALFAPAAVMLLLATQYGGSLYPWDSSIVIGLFCGAGGTFVIWLVWDYYKKDAALIPLPMLRQRRVWSSCLVFGFLSAAMFSTSYWLPIYFQGVRGYSPAISGVYLLPGILSQLVGAVISGKGVSMLGYHLPWSVGSAVLAAIGYGLLTTLDPHTPTSHWVGFQILYGFGRGFGLQMALVAIQNLLAPAQIPVAMSLLMFSSTIGGALFLSFANTIFSNSLRSLLPASVNLERVLNAGAYGVRNVVPKSELAGVLRAYAKSVDNVFVMCTALAVACFAFSWFMGWDDIREKKPKEAAK